MPRFERKPRKHPDQPGDSRADAPVSSGSPGSMAEAEDAAARIAELVRRSAERGARPGPSSVPRTSPTAAQPHPGPAQPVATPVTPPARPPERLLARLPSGRILIAAGAAVVVLIAGGLALAGQLGSDKAPAATVPTAQASQRSAPAGYAVKATDVITDCASHSHGRTQSSFEEQNCVRATRSLATGRVAGRPALFVVSRIQMPSPEAAATIKQVLDGTGTGNLDDLLRDGKTFPGAPEEMPSSGYTSVQSGAVVTVAEAGFVDDGESSSTDPALRAAAAQVAALVSAQT